MCVNVPDHTQKLYEWKVCLLDLLDFAYQIFQVDRGNSDSTWLTNGWYRRPVMFNLAGSQRQLGRLSLVDLAGSERIKCSEAPVVALVDV